MAIDLFGEGGLKICDRIEAIGYDVWEQRPVVTKLDAIGLLVKCLSRAMFRPLRNRASVSPVTEAVRHRSERDRSTSRKAVE